MELLEGRSLGALIREECPLPLTRVAHLTRQLSDALQHAHREGVAHRDVKPSNVFVRSDDHLTLVDFGIARAADGTHLTVTHGIGTPEYMAPEIFDETLGEPGLDEHALAVGADLYALGVVVYELLTGNLPFRGRTPQSVAFAHVHREPPPPRSIRPDIPEAVEAVVLRQMSKRLSQRYSSAGAFVKALSDAIRSDALLVGIRDALNLGDVVTAEERLADLEALGVDDRIVADARRRISDRQNALTSVRGLDVTNPSTAMTAPSTLTKREIEAPAALHTEPRQAIDGRSASETGAVGTARGSGSRLTLLALAALIVVGVLAALFRDSLIPLLSSNATSAARTPTAIARPANTPATGSTAVAAATVTVPASSEYAASACSHGTADTPAADRHAGAWRAARFGAEDG